jgi:DNA-binding MarR family transcriptional regulator
MPLPFDPVQEARRHWEARWGTDASPSMVAVTSIMRAQQIVMARLNDALAEWDLTFPRYEALMLLHFSSSGSLPMGKMGERLQVHRTSITNVVDGLERLGYAERTPHEHDRRTTLASITPRGRDVAEAATLTLNAMRFGTDGLGDGEMEELFALLRGLRAAAGDFAERG